MDKQQKRSKNSFSQLIGASSLTFKNFNEIYQESYLIGKKEAYEEILNLFLTCTQGDIRYVPSSQFSNSLTEKLKKIKGSLSNEEEEISESKFSEKKKQFSDQDITTNINNLFEPSGSEISSSNNGSTGGVLVNAPNKKKKFK